VVFTDPGGRPARPATCMWAAAGRNPQQGGHLRPHGSIRSATWPPSTFSDHPCQRRRACSANHGDREACAATPDEIPDHDGQSPGSKKGELLLSSPESAQKPAARNPRRHSQPTISVGNRQSKRPSGSSAWPCSAGRLEGTVKQGFAAPVETYQLDVPASSAESRPVLCNIGTSQRSACRGGPDCPGFAHGSHRVFLSGAMPWPASACPTCGCLTEASESCRPCSIASKYCCSGLEIEQPLLVRMTACPNGCSRPYMAEVGWWAVGWSNIQLLAGRHSRTHLALATP